MFHSIWFPRYRRAKQPEPIEVTYDSTADDLFWDLETLCLAITQRFGNEVLNELLAERDRIKITIGEA